LVFSFGIINCAEAAAVSAQPPQQTTGEQPQQAGAESGSTARDKIVDDEWRNRWFFTWGPANVHARLKETEAEIDHRLNDTFGRIIPGWEKPKTFKDWNDDFLLWDFHTAFGRDINRYWLRFVDVGGVLGTVKNSEDYWFFVPLKAHIDFDRKVWFAAAGVDWYPWGKPVVSNRKALLDIKATRPYFQLAAGHVHAQEGAKVKFSVRGLGPLITQDEIQMHDVNYISPRAGIETPIDDNDSVSVQAGYLFFDSHASDFNNLSVYFLHTHKF